MKLFVVNNGKFELWFDGILVAWSHFEIEVPNNIYDEKHISLFNLKTKEEYRRMGFMSHLLFKIDNYTRNILKVGDILLNVYKDNEAALNLYFKSGYKIYKDYVGEDYYTLIKRQ